MTSPTPPPSTEPAGTARPGDRLRTEVDRARGTMGEIREELRRATDERRDGPVTSVDDATAKLAALRDAIGRDVAELRDRPPVTAPPTGALVGAGAAALVLIVGVLLGRRRSARRRDRAAVRSQARALADELARLARDDERGDADRRGRRSEPLRLTGAAAAGAAVALGATRAAGARRS